MFKIKGSVIWLEEYAVLKINFVLEFGDNDLFLETEGV